MSEEYLKYFFVQELNEKVLKELNGGQYFKPSIDGSLLVCSNFNKFQSLMPK